MAFKKRADGLCFCKKKQSINGATTTMAVDQDLLKAVLSLDGVEEVNRFFEDIFTPAELEDISLRWKLLKDLHQGVTQRKIAQKYGISLCKITRGSKLLKNKDSMVKKILDVQPLQPS